MSKNQETKKQTNIFSPTKEKYIHFRSQGGARIYTNPDEKTFEELKKSGHIINFKHPDVPNLLNQGISPSQWYLEENSIKFAENPENKINRQINPLISEDRVKDLISEAIGEIHPEEIDLSDVYEEIRFLDEKIDAIRDRNDSALTWVTERIPKVENISLNIEEKLHAKLSERFKPYTEIHKSFEKSLVDLERRINNIKPVINRNEYNKITQTIDPKYKWLIIIAILFSILGIIF
jgi:hypothetical protein